MIIVDTKLPNNCTECKAFADCNPRKVISYPLGGYCKFNEFDANVDSRPLTCPIKSSEELINLIEHSIDNLIGSDNSISGAIYARDKILNIVKEYLNR